MINEKLFKLYKSKLPSLQKFYSELDDKEIYDYAGPQLLYCWEKNYLSSFRKTLIIGQETNSWYNDYIRSDEDIRTFIDKYKSFELDIGYKKLFMQYAHRINYLINNKDYLNFVYLNINKFGKEDEAGKPVQEVLDAENRFFNIFTDELQILKPDVCIFMTGPNYDKDIRNKLDNVEFSIFEGYPLNEVSKVKSKYLPIKSYRLYHPGYGNRYKEWYNELINKIVSDIIQ